MSLTPLLPHLVSYLKKFSCIARFCLLSTVYSMYEHVRFMPYLFWGYNLSDLWVLDLACEEFSLYL